MNELRPNNNYREFQGSLGLYRPVLTKDNSYTLWSEKFDENCHSLEGAVLETQYNFIEGCSLGGFLKNHPGQTLSILEVGFGTGQGIHTTLNWWMNLEKENSVVLPKLQFVSTEIDEGLVLWSLEHGPLNDLKREMGFEFRRQEDQGFIYWHGKKENIEIVILIGNARETTLKAFKNPLFRPPLAIFQDAFSPKKNPILWTIEWFQDLKKISHPDVKLATYSASISIRKAMMEAGWVIKNSKGLGQKRSMTKASLKGEMKEELSQMLLKTKIKALTDHNLK